MKLPYDLAIIGGGPAGMTAAVYARRAGLRVMMIEKAGFGGQVTMTSTIENYPAMREVEGFQLAMDMKAQVDALGAKSISDTITALNRENDGTFVLQTTGEPITARAVIIANGVRRRELGLPGEDRLRGRGISWCAVCDGGFFRRKKVAVIGAGNTALGDAIYLANLCEQVYVVFRREQPTASAGYLERLKELPNITLLPRHIPLEFKGEKRIEALSVKDLETDTVKDLEVGGVFEAIGLIPDNEIFASLVDLDENGYILADDEMCTRTEGLFVAGDTRRKNLRQIVTACSDGAIAATSAQAYLSR